MGGVDRLLSVRSFGRAGLARALSVIVVALAATLLTPAMAADATGHPVAQVLGAVVRPSADAPSSAQVATARALLEAKAQAAQAAAAARQARLAYEYVTTLSYDMKITAARKAASEAHASSAGVSRAAETAAASSASGYGCAAALAYLATHAAPGFTFECPGYADGHQAMTCINTPGLCSGMKLIAINDPCPAAYMNEASNSWVLEGLRSAPIDPYGYCES
jgi:hypothetical protein